MRISGASAYLGQDRADIELWRTRAVAAMVDAHDGVVAPHNVQGPVWAAIGAQLGACIPNIYVQTDA